jgi:hypothetical protein
LMVSGLEMANPYRAFRQLERKVFRGVPEQPESAWQRSPNAQATERLTGRALREPALPPADEKQVFATVAYEFRGAKISRKYTDRRARKKK